MTDVSRETPSAPAAAQRAFSPDRLPLAERYADALAGDGVRKGLIGPREVPRLWERHLLNCAVLGEAIPPGARLADIGSGAGLPGLVLAIARPDLGITLVEPLLRRATFLAEVVTDLGLAVEVVRERAEALHGVRDFDVVTARAVAPLDRLLGWAMPLVAPGGVLLAMKGASVTEELKTAGPVLTRLGCAGPDVLELGAGELETPTMVVRVGWAAGQPVSSPPPPAGAPPGSARRQPNRPQSTRREDDR